MKLIAKVIAFCGPLLALGGCAGMPDMKNLPIGSSIAGLVPGGSKMGSLVDSGLSVAKDVGDSQKVMSDAEEVELGENVMAGVLGAAPLYNSDRIQRYVNQVGRWVASHSERPTLPWNLATICASSLQSLGTRRRWQTSLIKLTLRSSWPMWRGSMSLGVVPLPRSWVSAAKRTGSE